MSVRPTKQTFFSPFLNESFLKLLPLINFETIAHHQLKRMFTDLSSQLQDNYAYFIGKIGKQQHI